MIRRKAIPLACVIEEANLRLASFAEEG